MKRPAWLALLFALGLAACTAGPAYRIPMNADALSPSAARPFMGGQAPAFSAELPPGRWWALYDDPRLNALVDEAERANTDLRAADANLRRAKAAVDEAKAARTVQTNISTSATAARVGGFTLPLPGAAYSYVLGVSLSYPLDLAGGIHRTIQAAAANAEAVQAARDEVRVAVAVGVTRTYTGVCSANRTLAATERVLKIQRQTLAAIEKLKAGGRATTFDVSRARAAVDQSAAAIPAIVAERQADLFELAAFLGRNAADFPSDVVECPGPPDLEQPIPIGDGWRLIRRRPDIRQAERTLASATASIGVETAQLYPQVSLGGSAGFAGAFSGRGSARTFGGAIGPIISWQGPNRSTAKARIAEAGAGADAALAEFDGSVVQALQQTETALSAYDQELQRERSLVQARDDAAAAAAQANRLFRFGRITFLDVLSAETVLADAEMSLASSRAQVTERQIDVFLALGGGWQTA